MSVSLSPIGGAASQFFNGNGVPLTGGKIYTYEAGTTTPKTSFTSANGLTAHPNPIVLDATGRVPGGEIWLTSAEAYKFVLKTSSETLIGTWDNILGYAAGTENAVTEVQVATAGQTDFVLTSMVYAPGSNTLGVYVDGVNQVVNNAYTEVSSTLVTFASGLHVGALVKFISINSAATDALLVTYLPAGAGAVITDVQAKLQETISVKDFGAVGDGVANDTDAIVAAIAYAAVVGLADGATVYFPSGTYLIDDKIVLPNRVGLQGANGRGSVIKPHSTFAAQYMFHANNGTSAMFGSWLRDFYIDARGKNMTAVVWSEAWQETCGMERVLIYFDGTTPIGFLYSTGYGGAATLNFKDIEIFADSAAALVRGILIGQVSVVGNFILNIDGMTISGSVGNPVDIGVYMANDSFVCTGYHAEYTDVMCSMVGAGNLSADTWTGSSVPVVDMVVLSAAFVGVANLRNMLPMGATGNVLTDNVSGRSILASEGNVVAYTTHPAAFKARVPGLISGVTGNATEYIVVFGQEIYDYQNNFNAANGKFTAPRTGKYLFTTCITLNVPTGSTTGLIRLNAGTAYSLYRGSFNNQRDSANEITINGSMIVDLNAGQEAYITVTVSGLGADTVSVLSGDSSNFCGQWLMR